MAHAQERSHHFRPHDLSILSSGHANWHERGVMEAIYIRGLQPSLNRDQGRHQLPPNYDSIITAAIKRPPAPPTHNNETEALLNTAPRRQGRPPRQQPVGVKVKHTL